MPDVNCIQIDTDGWHLVERSPFELVYLDSLENCTGVLAVNYFDKKPDIPARLSDIGALRTSYRALANAADGGLVSADLVRIDNVPSVATILKFPQQPHGITYAASVTIPFAEFSFVVKMEAPEVGTTGMREAALFAMIQPKFEIDQEELKRTGMAKMKGLGGDPYDPDTDYPHTPTIFEDELYDTQFPHHPLSRVRRWLTQMKTTTHLDQSVIYFPRFLGK